MRLPRLYPIVDRTVLDTRGMELAGFVQELAEAGVSVLQYRDKAGSPQRILRAAQTISRTISQTIAPLIRNRECLLVMNDRADLAWMAGWKAVHVGQTDLPPEAARRVLGGGEEPGRDSVVGVSTHTDQQVRSADSSSADYIAVGPVFATGSKADAEPVVGLEGVRRARALTRKPLVAIGGITAANAAAVISAGADSIAVISALLPVDGLTTGRRAEALLKALGSA